MFPTYGRYQGGHHEGNDDGLEHVEEELPDELDVHGIPAGPRLIAGVLQTHSQPDT